MTTSVRWKLPFAATVLLLLLQLIGLANAAKIESIDDGWRPIVGNQREGPRDEITHYRNPASKKADPVKAEKLSKPVDTPKKLVTNNVQSQSNISPVSKTAPHTKPVFLLPSIGMHNQPVMPMPAIPMHHHRPMKYSHLMKVHHLAKPPIPGRMKPVRHPMPSYSTRDEVFVPAPSSNVGPYTFFGVQPLKRPQPQPQHIDFTNHFPIPNSEDELFQLIRAPVHQYVIPKAPLSNDVHYTFQNPEEFNRSPQPAAIPYKFESTKEKVKKVKDVPRQEALIQNVGFHVTTPIPSKPVEIHVTKEKLKVFHNAIPSNYNPLEEYEYRPVKNTVSQKRPATYEVTEGKWNQETPTFQYQFTSPPKNRIPTRVFTEENKPFLPTPVKPDIVPPTLPTESEISTIYNQVKLNRQNVLPSRVEFSTSTPINFFDVKEVSTHYPIIGPPEFQTIAYPPSRYQYNDKENEITTKIVERPLEIYQHPEQPQEVQHIETTTEYIPTIRPQRPNRRPNRRRRPTSTTTTEEEVAVYDSATETYEVQKIESVETTTLPQRHRLPSRYRTRSTTTTPAPEESSTVVRHHVRQRRPRPTTTTEIVENVEVPTNHKAEYESLEEKFSRLTTTTEKDFPANFESHFTSPFRAEPQTEVYEKVTEAPEVVYRPNRLYTNPPNREEKTVEVDSEEEDDESASIEVQSEEIQKNSEEKNLDDLQEMFQNSQNAEVRPGVPLNAPENELDFTTKRTFYTTRQPVEEITTEVVTTPIVTTPAVTTTMTTTTTTTTTELPKRIRGRPVKYDHNNRPRFSVKDYKQRLTTSTTSTEAPSKPAPTNDMRLRFPHRSRRPITPLPTTTPIPEVEEDMGSPPKRFQPKDPRHPNESATEKLMKFSTVNTRIRPFGRFKSTTEPTTTTARVSIKPNIFGNLRRPTPISLKTRILNRQRTNFSSSTEKPEITTLDNNLEDSNENQSDQTEIVETTIPYSVEETDATAISADFGAKSTKNVDYLPETTIIFTSTTTQAPLPEIKNDDFMQSQIVSDLTSSAKNEYNKPGLFKNVQPNSRKVPSYFTLATDDPILPIEAFFPNLKERQ